MNVIHTFLMIVAAWATCVGLIAIRFRPDFDRTFFFILSTVILWLDNLTRDLTNW